MPLDRLPGRFQTPTRQEILDRYQRDYQLRIPGAAIGDNSLPFIEGSILADQLMPVHANAESVGNNTSLDDMTSDGLELEADDLGIASRLPATGGSGYVVVVVSAGGATIYADDEIRHEATGYRYRCTQTALYTDGALVPVEGIDVGPQTNLAAGVVLTWTSPRPGVGQKATIYQASNGRGLQGGRDEETNAEIANRIRAAKAASADAGNAAEIRKLVTETPGVPVEAVFVYPGMSGPGTTAWAFTLRPGTPGGSRAPTPVQIAAALAHVVGLLPGDDGHLACSIDETSTSVSLRVKWAQGAVGWRDRVPFPGHADAAVVSTAGTALSFSITTSGAAPQVGQTIAFYNQTTGAFIPKRILTVGGGGPYALTIDPSNASSDVNYVPALAETFCPWSDSLVDLVLPVTTAFAGLGPGEQVASGSLFDEGLRQRRDPVSPTQRPYTLFNTDFDAVKNLPTVQDYTVIAPTMPFDTPVGVAGVSSKLLKLGTLLAFPL